MVFTQKAFRKVPGPIVNTNVRCSCRSTRRFIRRLVPHTEKGAYLPSMTVQLKSKWCSLSREQADGDFVRERGTFLVSLEETWFAGSWAYTKANANHITCTHKWEPHWPKVFHYAKEMEKGCQFPPVQVYREGCNGRWFANDGAHRK